jgi:hypothetical protein
VGQATLVRHGQRFAGDHAAGESPDAYAVTYKTAGAPPDAAAFAGPDGDAVPAADRHAAADRDAACDEPACHPTAEPDAHFDSGHVGIGHLGNGHVGNAVAAADEGWAFAARSGDGITGAGMWLAVAARASRAGENGRSHAGWPVWPQA